MAQTYNIPTAPILARYGYSDALSDEDKQAIYLEAAQELVPLIRSGKIAFPYHRYFTLPPRELFANLKTIHLHPMHKSYQLRSYYPLYRTYLPPQFRGKPTTLTVPHGTYMRADVLSDIFIEDVRMRAKRYDQEYSIEECWNLDACLPSMLVNVFKDAFITPETLRDSIYRTTPETKIFSPSWARGLLELVVGPNLAGKKFLDISSGWGDRLLAAMSLDMEYVGCDPNTDLRPGHTQMIQMFGNPLKHRVIYEPFETAKLPRGPYDVVLSSPPYFNLEQYSVHEGQSILNYPDQNQWMVWFLFASLMKCWENLKDNGYLILHLGDARTIVTCEATNIFIENYLAGASWQGVLGVMSEAGFARPVWVWKKLPRNQKPVRWEGRYGIPSNERTLWRTYPDLQIELLRYFANKYAPSYETMRQAVMAVRNIINLPIDDLLIYNVLEILQFEAGVAFFEAPHADVVADARAQAPNYDTWLESADAVRDHIAAANPKIPRDVIQSILADNLMIAALLMTLDLQKIVTWATAMLKLATHT